MLHNVTEGKYTLSREALKYKIDLSSFFENKKSSVEVAYIHFVMSELGDI